MKIESLVLVASLLSATCAHAERPAWLLDPETGHVQGRRALVAYPVQDGSPTDPAGFMVHLDPFDGSSDRRAFSAGEWTTAPSGIFRVWLEGHAQDGSAWISSSSKVLSWTDQEHNRGMAIGISVTPAATVRVQAEDLSSSSILSAVRAEDHITEGGNAGEEVLRVMPLSEARGGFLMPAGLVQVRAVDPATGVSRALSQPVHAPAGAATVIQLSPLGPDEAGLVVIAKRPPGKSARSAEDYDAAAVVTCASGELEASAVSERRSLILATWPSLPPGPATVRVRSQATGLDLSREVGLEPASVQKTVLERVRLDPPGSWMDQAPGDLKERLP